MKCFHTFIDRPVLAGVLSALIVLAGALALLRLPIAEYPEVVPPAIVVRAQLPGANPKELAETVAAPLEEAINGTEHMLYMSSQANSDGTLTLTVTFELGADPDKAQQMVQNRVAQALQRLPEEVQRLGVTTSKSATDVTLLVHLVSPNGRYDMKYLSNYATLHVRDRLARIPGVADVWLFGAAEYAMRIWLDPAKVAEHGLTAGDVVKAIRAQNVQVAAGTVGAAPNLGSTAVQIPINAHGRLRTESEFGSIVLRASPDGGVTYLRDVARIELGTEDYARGALLDGRPAVALPVMRAPGSNALRVAARVRELMAELSKSFPEGVTYRVAYDPTEFVRASITAVIKTLLEATVLVVLVVILFLQTWRAIIIPVLAVPVSVIGSLSVMLVLGFSINTLSLFGLVLAIGIVVDDSIVVVENVERHVASGSSPLEAARQAMTEVSGPIVAIALTLVAVFIPLGFMPGLTGLFYAQCALTIAIATVISAINSLTLSPALAALLLRPHDAPADRLSRWIDRGLGKVFAGFNKAFARCSILHMAGVATALEHRRVMLALYVLLLAATAALFRIVPSGFMPPIDKQFLVGIAQLQDGASLERSMSIARQMSRIARAQPGVAAAVAFPGMSINGFTNSSSAGIVFAMLEPFEKRREPSLEAHAIAQSLSRKYAAEVRDATIAVLPPPAVNGLGTVGGFKMEIEDHASHGYQSLYQATQALIQRAAHDPALGPVFSSYQINAPQLEVAIDRVRCAQLGLPIDAVFEAMQVYLGSLYVNDFNLFGRTYRVKVQADARYRARAETIGELKVRNTMGVMVPLSSVITVTHTFGPEMVGRYNGYTAADLNGTAAPGYSSGQTQAALYRLATETLPRGFDVEWTDLAYQQLLAGNSAIFIFPLSLVLVFMVLAAQYESLTLPLAVILIVPTSMLAALTGVWLTGGDNNLFTQIGLMVLVGLACKNAILIVQFARELERRGADAVTAATHASRLRFRPILMTSVAFIAGVVPLVFSHGAGAEMRSAMGIAVFAGMIGVTLFGLFLTPMFYVVLRRRAAARHAAVVVPVATLRQDILPQ